MSDVSYLICLRVKLMFSDLSRFGYMYLAQKHDYIHLNLDEYMNTNMDRRESVEIMSNNFKL